MEAMTRVIRPLRNGQITIPADLRRQMQIDEHTLLQISLVGNELHIRPVKIEESKSSGSAWARELYEMFAPIREEAKGRTEEEVNADIDEAIKAVRSERGSRRS
jgi:AbrB family looped-hinge helix DNA binding protein